MLTATSDGYCENWHPLAGHAGEEKGKAKWPLQIPRQPILILRPLPHNQRQWICKECGWEGEPTSAYERPKHTCPPK